MARLQTKKQAAVTTGSAKSAGIPCAMVLTVSFVLSPGTGLSCPRRFAEDSTKLDASVGASGPHAFAVRKAPLVRASIALGALRPSHPALTFRDDRP